MEGKVVGCGQPTGSTTLLPVPTFCIKGLLYFSPRLFKNRVSSVELPDPNADNPKSEKRGRRQNTLGEALSLGTDSRAARAI